MRSRAAAAGRPAMLFCALTTYSSIGGLQNFNKRVISSLANRAKARGDHDLKVILLRDRVQAVPSIDDASIYTCPNRFNLFWLFLQLAWDCEILFLGHINLVPLAALFRLLHPKFPILLFAHGDEVWNDPRHRKARPLETLFLRLVTRIATVSLHTAEVMAREFHVPKTKFVLLPNAVDRLYPTRFMPIEEKQPMKLTVSRLGVGDKEKNVDKVLQAIALLRKELPNVRYEIIGTGVLKGELEKFSLELGLQENVFFHGRADEKTLHEAYARAAVFILPSSKEGFGIVYLEAWQHGLPVICGSEGASQEVITNGVDGYVVDPYDIPEIARCLAKILKDPLKAQKMGKCGLQKVEKFYHNTHFEKNLNRIIDDIFELTV